MVGVSSDVFNSVYVVCIPDYALCEQKTSRQLEIETWRSHRYRDRFNAPGILWTVTQSNFEWLLDGEYIGCVLSFKGDETFDRDGDFRSVQERLAIAVFANNLHL